MRRLLNKVRRRVDKWRGLGEAFSYDGFEKRVDLEADYQVLADSILDTIAFESVYDVGCANGFLLKRFLDKGKKCHGIELSPDVREILSAELNQVVSIGDFDKATGSWDLVSCIEVAEHVPPNRSEALVNRLSTIATQTIVFTAAAPGQSGHGHINCRNMSEWESWFSAQGWFVNEGQTISIRESIETIETASWLVENLRVFTKS